MTNARHLVLPLLLALAACGGNGGTPEGERKTAAGEVLGGSITDEMLPLDTVTSESPPLREASEEPEAGGTGSGAPSAAATTAAEPDASEPASDAIEAEPESEPAAAADE